MHSSPATAHAWKFYRIGDLDQAAIENGADLLALDQLDQKLWVALSCPVKGLELDEKTLTLIDADKDGRIRVPEILATIKWAAPYLKDAGDLLHDRDRLPVSAFNEATPEGAAARTAATEILTRLGRPDATEISLADATDTAKVFAATTLNGDGVIIVDSTADPALKAVIADIVATIGGTPDRSGASGVDQARIDSFYADCAAFANWRAQGEDPAVQAFGAGTAAASAAVQAVRAKIDDYFARSRLAAFDTRALIALNRSEDAYLELATKDLSLGADELTSFPLARVEVDQPLRLDNGVNPAWTGALATFRAAVVSPGLGAGKVTLSEPEWAGLKARVAAYDAWIAAKAGAAVESLGLERIKAILAADQKAALSALVAEDAALAGRFAAIASVEKLLRLARDFRTLLANFVNFTDLYSPDRYAIFQAGVLYLDSRSCELCVPVADPASHSTLAGASYAYLAYCDLKRAGGETMKIVAAFTQGDSDFLRVGRNGIFYDRKGRDWDATITKLVDNPISIRQSFWAPYKKVARFVEDQIAKFAAAKEKSADANLAAGVTSAGTKPADGRPAFDIAKFAGIFAAIGLALGAIGSAIASVATGFLGLAMWQMPLAIAGALLVISGPSMLLAALKLRQRNLGPILDANGWAINGRVRINIPFGTKLTERALLPANARRVLTDPYADKSAARRKRTIILLVVVLAVIAAAIRWDHNRRGHYFWQKPAPVEAPP
ncbi:MAG TPA: hypothetical protein VGD81_14250, partial [Opitutaceae bacterium]